MWLRKGEALVLVPEHMSDTITRCLRDGWAEVPDPRTLPAHPDTEPQHVATLPQPTQPQTPMPQHPARSPKRSRPRAAR